MNVGAPGDVGALGGGRHSPIASVRKVGTLAKVIGIGPPVDLDIAAHDPHGLLVLTLEVSVLVPNSTARDLQLGQLVEVADIAGYRDPNLAWGGRPVMTEGDS